MAVFVVEGEVVGLGFVVFVVGLEGFVAGDGGVEGFARGEGGFELGSFGGGFGVPEG